MREELQERFLEEGRLAGKAEGKEETLRSNILALRDVLAPEGLAEKLQVSLDYVL